MPVFTHPYYNISKMILLKQRHIKKWQKSLEHNKLYSFLVGVMKHEAVYRDKNVLCVSYQLYYRIRTNIFNL